jgi:hypothetical protein
MALEIIQDQQHLKRWQPLWKWEWEAETLLPAFPETSVCPGIEHIERLWPLREDVLELRH